MTKKKIKRFSIIAGLMLLIGLAVFAIPQCRQPEAVYAASVETQAETQVEVAEKFSWKEWFKEKVLPILISSSVPTVAITTLLCAGLKTITTFVQMTKMSKGNFEQVSSKLIESQSSITEFKDSALVEMKAIKETFAADIEKIASNSKESIDEIRANIEESMNKLSTLVSNSIKIMQIAFGNDGYLVKNGYANQIMKVGGENEEIKQNENSDNIDANT